METMMVISFYTTMFLGLASSAFLSVALLNEVRKGLAERWPDMLWYAGACMAGREAMRKRSRDMVSRAVAALGTAHDLEFDPHGEHQRKVERINGELNEYRKASLDLRNFVDDLRGCSGEMFDPENDKPTVADLDVLWLADQVNEALRRKQEGGNTDV